MSPLERISPPSSIWLWLACWLELPTPKSSASPQLAQLRTANDLPPWFSPYPYVRTGYRVHFSAGLCLRSLWQLHNETLNVWTEFAPAIGFGYWSADFLQRHNSATATDRWLVGSCLIGATVVRPLCSGLAHLLACMSPRGYIFWWSVDYVSISLAILASSLVYGHFAF